MQGKALLGKYKSKEKSEFIFSSSDRFDEHVDRSRAVIHKGFKYIKHFNPEISRTNNAYRDNMAMMKNMKKLWDEGKLGKDQAHWFKNPKPLEEMYLLNDDPYELNNIVDYDFSKSNETLLIYKDKRVYKLFSDSNISIKRVKKSALYPKAFPSCRELPSKLGYSYKLSLIHI